MGHDGTAIMLTTRNVPVGSREDPVPAPVIAVVETMII